MALAVTITRYDGVGTLTLKTDSIDHSITRNITQAAMPGDDDSKQLQNYVLDLGMGMQSITMSGTVDTDAPDDGSCTKAELEESIKQWWQTGVEKTDNCTFVIGGVPYSGAFKSATFRQSGALEDRWEYVLTILVVDGIA